MIRRSTFLWLSCLVLFFQGCTRLHYPSRWDAGPFPGFDPQAQRDADLERLPSEQGGPEVRKVLAFARKRIGSKRPLVVNNRRYRFDCSGYVNAAYASAGIDLSRLDTQDPSFRTQGNTAFLFKRIEQYGLIFKHNPKPGDLVFFDNTWDRNGDGRLNDRLTHMGIVSRVDASGTLEILHLDNSGIGILRMNLQRPHARTDRKSGEIINDALRRRRRSDPPGTPYLASQLFHAFGRPLLDAQAP